MQGPHYPYSFIHWGRFRHCVLQPSLPTRSVFSGVSIPPYPTGVLAFVLADAPRNLLCNILQPPLSEPSSGTLLVGRCRAMPDHVTRRWLRAGRPAGPCPVLYAVGPMEPSEEPSAKPLSPSTNISRHCCRHRPRGMRHCFQRIQNASVLPCWWPCPRRNRRRRGGAVALHQLPQLPDLQFAWSPHDACFSAGQPRSPHCVSVCLRPVCPRAPRCDLGDVAASPAFPQMTFTTRETGQRRPPTGPPENLRRADVTKVPCPESENSPRRRRTPRLSPIPARVTSRLGGDPAPGLKGAGEASDVCPTAVRASLSELCTDSRP